MHCNVWSDADKDTTTGVKKMHEISLRLCLFPKPLHEMLEPIVDIPYTERPDPNRKKFRMLSADPMCAKSRTDTELDKSFNPYTETPDPTRTKLRTDILLPKLQKSSTESIPVQNRKILYTQQQILCYEREVVCSFNHKRTFTGFRGPQHTPSLSCKKTIQPVLCRTRMVCAEVRAADYVRHRGQR